MSTPLNIRSCLLVVFWVALAGPAGAADKNGVSPNAISLPSGPGSIEGLGDSFQPALNSGTMRHGLSLQLPSGTAGHAPAVHLTYEGGQGNGPLGFGWSLPLRYIQRQTDKGIPRYIDGANGRDDDRDGQMDEADELDKFINDGKEELVPVANGDYFCQNEESFVRYRRLGEHWEGTLPNGTKMEFGLTETGRVMDGTTTNHVFKWLLERETDTRGNTILYSWQTFPGSTNLNQKYLQEIRYGPGASPWANFHFASFTYEDRADWFEDCRSGFAVRTGKRLKEVIVGTQGVTPEGHATGDFNGDGSPDVLNRKYRLTYLGYAPGQSHGSLLHEVTQVGADGMSTLPPARFDYSISNPPATVSAASHLIGGTNEPPFVMDNANVELSDLNGDGLPDLLRTGAAGGAHIAYLNGGEQTNGDARVIKWAPGAQLSSADGLAWNVTLQSATDVANLSDMNGDGLADLAYKSALGDVFFFANQGALGWGTRQFMSPQDTQPPAPFGHANARSADLNFDKRMDVIESISSGGGADYRIWLNLGNQRYARSLTVPQTSGFMFALSGVLIADFNGDRVPDVVRIQPTTLTITAGLGYGNFLPPVTVSIPDWTFDGTQIAKARLEDINGDGVADLVLERAAPGQVWYWLNQGNYTLEARRMITGLPGGLSTTTRWADINGDGITDLIYADSTASPRILAVDLGRVLGCAPSPNTLTRFENGIGRVTTIEYAPSTRFALADAAIGNAWTNRLPFPVTVVARVLTDDSLGHTYEMRFRYHQGYYDAAEKEFRGFASAEQIEVGDSTAPTLVTRSYFDTGRDFGSMKGKLLRLTTEQEDGKAFWDEVTSWTVPPRILHTGTNGQSVHFVHETARTKRVKERAQGIERVVESESAFDAYGNQTLDANYGLVLDGDRSAFDDERIITNEFALNLDAWILRLPSRSEVRDENGAVVSRFQNFYDDQTFSGNNAGQVQVGNLTMRREWFAPHDPNGFVKSIRTRYDGFGNAIMQLDPLAVAPNGVPDPAKGHFRDVSYDPEFNTFAVAETVRLEAGKAPLVTEAVYDHGFGTTVLSRDYNHHETLCAYDPFGRLRRLIRPGDSVAWPTTEFDYVLARPVGSNRVVNFTETRSLDTAAEAAGGPRDHYLISRQFTDGLGRALLTKKEAEPAPGSTAPRVLIQDAAVFNARQKLSLLLKPCFTLTSGSLDQLLEFEDVSLPGWQGLFHLEEQLIPLDLPTAHKTTTSYDATLREISRSNPDGTSTHVMFEPFIEIRSDENDTAAGSPHQGTPHVLYQDGLGRQIRTEERVRLNNDGTPSGSLQIWTTEYAFDLNDQLIRVTDAQGNVKQMVFDGLKRLQSMNDPDRGISTIDYDDGSNRIETRDAKGQRITFTYDGANRLLTEDYHDEAQPSSAHYAFDPALPVTANNRPDIAYFYDQPLAQLDLGNGSTGVAQNTKSMLAYVWDLSGEEHRSYDARRRDSWTVKRVRDPRDGTLVSYRSQQTHDSLDRIAQTIYPDNDSVQYTYNNRGLLIQIAGDSAAIISDVEYLPSGQARTTKYGNGVRTTRDYDGRSRLRTLITARDSAPGQPYVAFAYEFDGSSNIEWIRDQRPGLAVPAGSPRRNTQRFDYDDLNRVTRVRYGFGVSGDDSLNGGNIEYRYDRIGNLIAQTSDIQHLELGKSVTHLGTLAYGGIAGASGRIGRNGDDPGPHAVSQSATSTNSTTYGYDADGNVVAKDGATLVFDFKDRLVSIEDASTRAAYTYDYQHRRIIKRVVAKPDLGTNLPSSATGPELTFYVSPSFEVRPPELPLKFVWNGPARVARVSGSLSGNPRLQRLRLTAGWNLVSLVISVADLRSQLPSLASSKSQAPIVETALRWNPAAQSFSTLSPGESVVAGAVLWLKASTAGTLTLSGSYADLNLPTVALEPNFLTGAGFDGLALTNLSPAGAGMWAFDPDAQGWLTRLPQLLSRAGSLPPCLAPGSAVFLRPDAPVNFATPDASLRIRYYHPDHLGSSGVMTDQTGALVEEAAYYPFGVVRHAYQPRSISEPYQFTQKERDAESGLHYFEARYLAGNAGRFISVDPLYVEPLQLGGQKLNQLLSNPQDFNLYSYARNNPLAYTDPTGYDPENTLPRSVLPFTSVLPCRNTDIAGHGAFLTKNDVTREANGSYTATLGAIENPSKAGDFVVPNDTTITAYAPHGFAITEELGQAIQLGQLRPEQFKVTYHPGDRIPNYLVLPPTKGMRISHRSGINTVTVSEPTSLSSLIKPGMGAVNLAICLEDVYPPWKTGNVGMDVLKPGADPAKGSWAGYHPKP
jgi:RHS repeat-associated protein